MNWKNYELEIFDYFKSQYPDAEISHNVKVTGRYSKSLRQIDILIEQYVAGNRIRIVIDGKKFSKRIDVKHVEMFISMLDDCEADKGLMITEQGYSKAAMNRAHYGTTNLELDILNFKDLTGFQGLGGIVYKDQFGVLVSPPFGWILDGASGRGFLAALYQRGLVFETALESTEFIYVDISAMPLTDLLDYQKRKVVEDRPKAIFESLPTVKRNDYKTHLRKINYLFPIKEFTGFVEFDGFVFFAVLLTTEESSSKNRKKLESIMLSAIPINMNYKSSSINS